MGGMVAWDSDSDDVLVRGKLVTRRWTFSLKNADHIGTQNLPKQMDS